jgi:hypothetical protein
LVIVKKAVETKIKLPNVMKIHTISYFLVLYKAIKETIPMHTSIIVVNEV